MPTQRAQIPKPTLGVNSGSSLMRLKSDTKL